MNAFCSTSLKQPPKHILFVGCLQYACQLFVPCHSILRIDISEMPYSLHQVMHGMENAPIIVYGMTECRFIRSHGFVTELLKLFNLKGRPHFLLENWVQIGEENAMLA